jgi:ABC-2 type transport system permease protein
MRTVAIVIKDLKQMFKDWKVALFLVVAPILFTILMGVALSGAGAEKDNRLSIAWINNDNESGMAAAFGKALQMTGDIKLEERQPDQYEKMKTDVRQNRLAGALVVPEGFGKQILNGKVAQIEVIVNEGSSEAATVGEITRLVISQLLSAVQGSRLSAMTQDQLGLLADEAAFASAVDQGVQLAFEEWNNPPYTVVVEKVGAEAVKKESKKFNPYTQSSPGMIIQFTINGLVASAAILTMERRQRTLQRLLTTSVSKVEIFAGHFLAMFVIILLQQTLLVIFGQFLGVDYLRQPMAILLVMVGLSLWLASMGLLIGAAAKSEDQVVLFSLIAMFLFTALGGAWFPLEGTGKAFYAIAHFTPGAWAMDGFQNIIQRGLDITSVLLPFGVLVGYALLFFVIAVWQFRKETA